MKPPIEFRQPAAQDGAPIPRRDPDPVTESDIDRARRLNRERQARFRVKNKKAKS